MNILIFLIPLAIGVLVMPFLIKFSEKTGRVVDIAKDDALKIHKKPTSLLGGLGMALSFFLVLLMFTLKNNTAQTAATLAGFLIIFCVMFYDDLKWKHISTIRPFLKFPMLILSALIPAIILSFTGIVFDFIPFYVVSVILGAVYIFTVINSVNYQDGMDGLAGGQVAISLIGFAWLSTMANNSFALTLSLATIGAVLAFLVFNFPPAKIFMGDSGAYSVGFILAVLAMLFSKPYNIYSVIAPIFIIGLPIFDGIWTNLRRLLAGKSIFFGDRSHFYDKLLQKRFSTKKTLAICYFVQVMLVVVGILTYA